DCLFDGVPIFKEFLFDLGPDDANVRCVLNLLGGEKASITEALIFHACHPDRHAGDASKERFMPIMFEIDRGIGLRADLSAGLALIAEPLVILDIEPFVAPPHLLSLLLGHSSLMGKAVDHKMIDAQHLRDRGQDISIEAADRSSYNHDRGDADNDAY